LKSTFIFILFLNLLICCLAAQTAIAPIHHPKDSMELAKCIDRCDILMEKREWGKALQIAEDAMLSMQGEQRKFIKLQTKLLLIQGDCQLELSQFKRAANLFETALLTVRRHGELDSITSDVLNKIGNLQLSMRDPIASIAPLTEALEIRQHLFGPDHPKVADVLNNLGIAYSATGDLAKAQSFHRQALRIRRGYSPSEPADIAQSLNNLGQSLQDGTQFQEAIDHYTEGLSIYQSLDENYQLQIGDLNLNISTVFFDLGDIDQSLKYLDAALQGYRKILPMDHPSLAICYNNMANSYSILGDTKQAEYYYEKALSIRKKTFGEHHAEVAETLLNIGRNFWFEGDYETANLKFESAFDALKYDRTDSLRLQKVSDHQLLLTGLYYSALSRKEAYQSLGNVLELEEARVLSQELDHLLDYLRLQYEATDSKLNLAAYGHTVYDLAIDVMLSLNAHTGQLRYLHEAFRYSEKGKGLILLDAFHAARAESFGSVPDKVIASVHQIEVEIAETEKEYFLRTQVASPSELDSLQNRLFLLQEEFSKRIEGVNQKYPEYYNLRYGATTPSVARIQQTVLRNDQTLIEYFLGNLDLRIFVLNQNGLEVKSIPLTVEFLDAIDSFNLAIRQFPYIPSNQIEQNLNAYANSAVLLYRNLIAPVEDLLDSNLIIIPDGKLGFLPFDALLRNPIDSFTNFRDHPYMIRDFAISYNYSATLLSEMVNKAPIEGLKPYLGFAPDFSESPVTGLSPLLHNIEEVNKAQETLGGRVYIGGKATKSNFIAHQEDYNILHLATHGKVDESDDVYSYLAFGSEDYLDPDQYSLFVRDIYGLSINAQLIILSACETGAGKLFSGEGIVSIARSFSYAGAASILATRWSINDKTTNNFMGYFLDQVKLGNPKDASVRNATLKYLDNQNQQYAHPFYWSSFMIFGDMEPILFPESYNWWIIPTCTIAMLLIGYLLFTKIARRPLPKTED